MDLNKLTSEERKRLSDRLRRVPLINIREEISQEQTTIQEEQAATNDPLGVYIRCITLINKMFPGEPGKYALLTMLRSAANEFKGQSRYKQDSRYLSLWIEYSKCVDDPGKIFEFLIENGIGDRLALFYEEYASYLETLQKHDEAWESYLKGIEIKAEPVQRLTHGLKTRIKDIISQKSIKAREKEAKRRMNKLKSSIRSKERKQLRKIRLDLLS